MRGRTAVVVGAGLVLLLGAAGFLVLDTDARGLLPGAPDCTVTVGEREVGLSSAEAASAARTTARVVRRRRDARVGGRGSRHRAACSQIGVWSPPPWPDERPPP